MGVVQDITTIGDKDHPNKYQEIVDGLKNGTFKDVVFITGAGISTAAGIPDFRSKGGLFEQTKNKYNLGSPEEFFQIDLFYKHPEYFYDFCKGFDISNCKPTKAHLFMGFLINKKGCVRRIFTQNIDGLELLAGVPEDFMTFAHGTITKAGCPNCMEEYDIEIIKAEVLKGKVYYCSKCGKPVKPKVVFYGESLPNSFYTDFEDIYKTDLAFIMGSSLKVFPFTQLPYGVPKTSWRVMMNREKASNFMAGMATMNQFRFDNSKKKDLFLGGDCDTSVMKLVQDCGWTDEFNEYCQIWLNEFEKNKDKDK